MNNNNLPKLGPSKLEIDTVILTSSVVFSNKLVSFLNETNFLPINRADIFKNLADAIMISYHSLKDKNSYFYLFR